MGTMTVRWTLHSMLSCACKSAACARRSSMGAEQSVDAPASVTATAAPARAERTHWSPVRAALRPVRSCAARHCGRDVAASLCRRSAPRRRCFARRKAPRRRQGCYGQRPAQETGGDFCQGNRAWAREPGSGKLAGRVRQGDPARSCCERAPRGVDMVQMAAARCAARNACVDTPQTSRLRFPMRGAWWAVAPRG
jgi:hypothetical protein